MKRTAKYEQPVLIRHAVPRVGCAKAAGECALLLVFAGEPSPGAEVAIHKVGTNLVVSWPVSGTPFILESSSALKSNWAAVTLPAVTNSQTISITVPAVGPQQFYRLKEKLGEKDSWGDKDPSEKDKDWEGLP